MSVITTAKGCTACGWESEPTVYEPGEVIVLSTTDHVCPTEGDI